MLGTVYYSSPEQVAGDPIDHRSDLYSLGVVGFLALTGRFPFDSELASAVLVAHVNKPAPTVRSINPSVPPDLAEIIDRCLAKDPDDRFTDAMELVDALRSASVDSQGPAPRPMLVSDAEANSVWSRAASLQASTSARARPEPIRRRDPVHDSAREDGLRLNEVVEAGREAGISTRFLDRALVEHGLRGAAIPARLTPVGVVPRKSPWASVPLEIGEEAEVEGQVSPEQFDRLTNILRSATQTIGATSASTRDLEWQTEWFGHQLEVSIVPDKGWTSVRLRQRMTRMAGTTVAAALFLGAVNGWVAARLFVISMQSGRPSWWLHQIGLAFGVGRQDIEPVAGSIALTVWLCSFLVARVLIRRSWRSNAGRLRLLAEALVANIRASTTRR
jgi:hypothetical protein